MQTKDWITTMIENAVKNFNGRKIVLWGYCKVSDILKFRLKREHNIEIAFYVDNDESRVSPECYSPECINRKSNEYYVIIPLAYSSIIKEQIVSYGFEKDKDFDYFCDCVIEQREDYYEDSHGNKIIGNYRGLKFGFFGFNSIITIGKSACFINSEVFTHNSSILSIGDNTRISDAYINMYSKTILTINKDNLLAKTTFCIKDNSQLEIGRNCVLQKNDFFMLHEESLVKIGNNLSVTEKLRVETHKGTSVTLGNDCMLSWDVQMISNDGHSIFDVKTGENLNSSPKMNAKRKIIIGNHVWIGMHSKILCGTEIGDGSIIGAGSVVKSKISNNCIAAGSPARTIRRDVAWSRRNCSDNISDCGEEYIKLTQE